MTINRDIKKSAIDYLSRREHSQAELNRKLRQKKFPDDEIASVLTQLIADNLQSDLRFAESYVRYRKQAGFGPLRIAMELQERGVSDTLIPAAIDEYANEWQTHMIAVFEKKFDFIATESHLLAKQFRFLSGRGFEADQINRFLFRSQE